MLSRAVADVDAENVGERFTQGIIIREAGFVLKTLVEDDERIQAYRLRHRVFCEELGWVPRSETLLEIDEYDRHAVSIGIFDPQHALVACMRLAFPGAPFMIEREFSSLIGPWHKIRKQSDATEVTRACVAPEARRLSVRGTFGAIRLSMLGYKGVYHWCSMNHIRYVYIVVEYKLYRMLRAQGFQVQPVGAPVTMSDGCLAVAAIFDWQDFFSINTANRPDFAKWFTLYEADRPEEPRRQLGFYSQRQASP
jgi:N-acyl amino acid synthase of PEP-CTERM/exosortase system